MSDQKSVNRLSLFEHEITMQSWNFLKKRIAKESALFSPKQYKFLEGINESNELYIHMNGTEPNEAWCIELFEMYYLGCYGGVCRYRRTRNLYVSLYFFFFLFSLSVFTLCRIAFRGATESYAVYYEQQWLGAKQSHFHTSNTVPASVAERAWWLTKFQSLLLNI